MIAAAAGAQFAGEAEALEGGSMAQTEPNNVAGDLYKGPDAGKGDVDPKIERMYVAVDTQVTYYGDGNNWVKMGVGSSQEPVPSVTTDESVIKTDRDPRPDADIISISDSREVLASQFPVGSSLTGSPGRLLTEDVSGITSTSWTEIGSQLLYGYIKSPPNTVAMVRAIIDMSSDDSGETLEVGITTPNHGTPPIATVKTGSGTNRDPYPIRFYPSEIDNQTSVSNDLGQLGFQLVARVSGGSTGGTVYETSSVAFDYEVI